MTRIALNRILRGAAVCTRGVHVVTLAVLIGGTSEGSDLFDLAGIDGAPGDESRVIEFIRERVGGSQRVGANGSLLATFGGGSPKSVLVAGVAEPGYVVSAIHAGGYLWLRPMADSPFRSGLGQYFRGQHVQVSTRSGRVVPGVVAAPSVHFGLVAGTRPQADPATLLVDIGTDGPEQVRQAGVAVLDRVTLLKRVASVGADWLSAPWISSRAGAAMLVDLARRLPHEPPDGTVTLAFVTQQYPHNAGIARVLRSEPADRIILVAPHGGSSSVIAPATGTRPGPIETYLELAEGAGLELQ